MERIMQNFISTETSSQTAMACEQAALFGATPGLSDVSAFGTN